MTVDDLMDEARDKLSKVRAKRVDIDAAVEAGLAEVEEERKKIRAGTGRAKVVERLTAAFIRGAKAALL